MVIHFRYLAKRFKVNTTFLYGELEDEIYMEYPQGTSNVGKDDHVILNKRFWPCSSSKAVLPKGHWIVKNLVFIGGNVDPCLYIKKSAKVIENVALYVDDHLMVGNIEAIDDAIAALKYNGLVFKVVEGL